MARLYSSDGGMLALDATDVIGNRTCGLKVEIDSGGVLAVILGVARLVPQSVGLA